MRADIIRTYKEVHGWVGILSGLALFICFYAGAITMFEPQIERWAAPATQLAAPPSLSDTPRLVAATLAAHPEAAARYQIHILTGPDEPARMTWQSTPEKGEHQEDAVSYASSLRPDGTLQVIREERSPVAHFIDVLHQQAGLPLDHELAMPIVGVISLLYVVALTSGVIILLPSLIKDLFAMRIGKNVKRMWLDLHNVLGIFSLPFHIVMAFTAVVFALHDPFYAVQDKIIYGGNIRQMFEAGEHPAPSVPIDAEILTPMQIIHAVAQEAPGFSVAILEYFRNKQGVIKLRISGTDHRYGLRAPTFGFAEVDPYSGKIISADYMPGKQDGWYATVTSFFALHFGNYGGMAVRWGYFFLGLAGALSFYTGNLLWIESRRRKECGATTVVQTRASRNLAALTVGGALGTVAGISLTLAAAKWLPGKVMDMAAWHSDIFYLTLLASLIWAGLRGAARSGWELLLFSASVTALIPVSSITAWLFESSATHSPVSTFDLVAGCGAIVLTAMAVPVRQRSRRPPRDSVWAL